MKDTSEGKILSLSIYPKISSTIALGATTIGSAGRALDDISEQSKQLRDNAKEKNILEPIPKKTFKYILGGYSHQERWARTQQNFIFKNDKRDERRLIY
jgi:hypothetical protein